MRTMQYKLPYTAIIIGQYIKKNTLSSVFYLIIKLYIKT